MISSIRLKNIRKRYKGTPFCLKIDNLEFHNRHIHVIVGPNGSGKSTILNLIAFLDKSESGHVLVDGHPVFNNKHDVDHEIRKKIGYVRQNRYLFDMSVFHNVALGLKIRKQPKNEITAKVDNILTELAIEHLRNRSVKSLSNGEYQKVAIAQVLVLMPEIILIDEPDTNIDILSTPSIERTIKKIQKERNSVVVMTTHSLKQARRMSPEIISIQEGRVIDSNDEKLFFEND
ncbi:energy-coupling factor ABC transporter ATP-binding protein [candidate division KSB1 bacterium]|nr:energy-coupling factor ABC transporter ATP-binding protein [candidate division KSB1 bacterium]